MPVKSTWTGPVHELIHFCDRIDQTLLSVAIVLRFSLDSHTIYSMASRSRIQAPFFPNLYWRSPKPSCRS